jgi:hypothetical protein
VLLIFRREVLSMQCNLTVRDTMQNLSGACSADKSIDEAIFGCTQKLYYSDDKRDNDFGQINSFGS